MKQMRNLLTGIFLMLGMLLLPCLLWHRGLKRNLTA
jgi:hypothetical protein